MKILKDSGKCPLCDSLIGQNMIENIIANYEREQIMSEYEKINIIKDNLDKLKILELGQRLD